MYEIAGDGAGILPAPSDGKGPVFPKPEYGKQFDFSALWHGKILGADNSTTLTYFWRDSDRMLQLYRVGLDYWSYFNDNKGKAHGIEFQSNWKWNKFSIDAELTYTKCICSGETVLLDMGTVMYGRPTNRNGKEVFD